MNGRKVWKRLGCAVLALITLILLLIFLTPILLWAGYAAYDQATRPAHSARGSVHTWRIVVPTHFTGVLIVRYACPGGQPLLTNGDAEMRFTSRGIACVRDDAFYSWSNRIIQRADGQRIVDGDDGLPAFGTAFISLLGHNVNDPVLYDAYYVGPVTCIQGIEGRVGLPDLSVPAYCRYEDPDRRGRWVLHQPATRLR